MNRREKLAAVLHKYKHAWVLGYFFIYMPWFMWLEKTVTGDYYIIHSVIDDMIPFVEYFIIPYLFWFVFIVAIGLYFFFTDVEGFYKLAKITIAGMTLFLIISTVMPNGLNLRPEVFKRDNIFVDMVRFLYRADTSTNVFPSLHVFNSLAVCIAVYESEALKAHRKICYASYLTAGLIVLSTMFLKQHSIIDVMAAFVIAYILYQFVYVEQPSRVTRPVKHRHVLLGSK